jgi:hypothetical protein
VGVGSFCGHGQMSNWSNFENGWGNVFDIDKNKNIYFYIKESPPQLEKANLTFDI